MTRSKVAHSSGLEGQNSLFGEDEVAVRPPSVVLSDAEPSAAEMVEYLSVEKEMLGVSLSSTHPVLDLYNRLKGHFTLVTTAKAAADTTVRQKARSIKIVGLVREVRTIRTKKGDAMAFVTLEDGHGELPCVAFPDAWRRLSRSVEEGTQLLCEGKLSYNQARDEQSLHLEEVRTYTDLQGYQARESAAVRQPVASSAPVERGEAPPDAAKPAAGPPKAPAADQAQPKPATRLPDPADAQGGKEPRAGMGETDAVPNQPPPVGRGNTATESPAESARPARGEVPAEIGSMALHLRLDEGQSEGEQVDAVRNLDRILKDAGGTGLWEVKLVVSVNGRATGFRYPNPMPLDPDAGSLPEQLKKLGVRMWVEGNRAVD